MHLAFLILSGLMIVAAFVVLFAVMMLGQANAARGVGGSKIGKAADPEFKIQERGGWVAWVVFHLFALGCAVFSRSSVKTSRGDGHGGRHRPTGERWAA